MWQEAQALVGAGYDVSVICPAGKGYNKKYELLDGVHIYRHVLREARSTAGYAREYATALLHQWRLSFRVRRRQRIDVIQACNPPDLMFLVALGHKLLFGTRFVFDHHDLGPELYVAKFGRMDLAYRAMCLFERLTFRFADASVATNEVFRELAISRGGMRPDRVSVVKSYPELGKFQRTEPDATLLALNRHLVGYIGIMGEQDGVEILIRAMADLRNVYQRNDVHCVLIGAGPELSNLRHLSAKLGLENHVTFTGYLSGHSLMSHLSALQIGVIPDAPNDFNDKLSMNKVFEYMMLGLPIVQFNLRQATHEAEGASIVVEHCPSALAEGLIALIEDPERRAQLGRSGLETARRKFLWSTERQKYLAAYEAILGQEKSSHDQHHHSTPRPSRATAELSGVSFIPGKQDAG